MNSSFNFFRHFLAISYWQSALALLVLLLVAVIFAVFIKRMKPKFSVRIFIGLFLGLIFGLIIQAVTGFDSNNISKSIIKKAGQEVLNPHYIPWVGEVLLWTELLKAIFITGIQMLTMPLVFLAIARICAKKVTKGRDLVKFSVTGIIILLINVAVAFTIAFTLGMIFKIGSGYNLKALFNDSSAGAKISKKLPDLIISYVPNNFFAVFSAQLVIPVIVVGALIGFAIKRLTKKNEVMMDQARFAFETMWKIVISILLSFIKIMPLAMLSIIASAIINQPIADLKRIGLVLGVAYLALIITFFYHLLTLWLFGIKPMSWLQKIKQPLLLGFTSQSSSTTLPLALKTLTENVKVKVEVSDTILPLSTTIGLSGCAGVQSGIIVTFLWHSLINVNYSSWNIVTLFISALFITLIVSLGVTGVPGTALVVTNGVLSGLGFGGYYYLIYGIIGTLDGLFDMGRTFVNISGGMQATTIVASNNALLANDDLQMTNFVLLPVLLLAKKVAVNLKIKRLASANLLLARLDYQKVKRNLASHQVLAANDKLKLKATWNAKVKEIRMKKKTIKANITVISRQYQQELQHLKITLKENMTEKKEQQAKMRQLQQQYWQNINAIINKEFLLSS